jgi:ligand-binding sensor protein
MPSDHNPNKGDIMELIELLSVEEWANLEEELHQYSGLNVHVYDKQGQSITPYNAWANILCPLIREFPQGLTAVCAPAQQRMTLQAKKTKNPVISECDIGLAKFVIPIYMGVEFLGCIGGCGQLFPDSELEFFLISKITGNDMQELKNTNFHIKEILQEKVEQLIQLFQSRVNGIVTSSGKKDVWNHQ